MRRLIVAGVLLFSVAVMFQALAASVRPESPVLFEFRPNARNELIKSSVVTPLLIGWKPPFADQAIASLPLPGSQDTVDIKSNYDMHMESGKDFFADRKYLEAIREYGKAIDLKPDHPKAYFRRGNAFYLAYYLEENYEKAEEDFTLAIGFNPKYVEAYDARGQARMELAKWQDAIKDFDQFIAFGEDVWAYIYNKRGECHYELGEFQMAIDDHTKAIDMSKGEEDVPKKYFDDRGLAYRQLGFCQLAYKDFEQALHLDADYDEAAEHRSLDCDDQQTVEVAETPSQLPPTTTRVPPTTITSLPTSIPQQPSTPAPLPSRIPTTVVTPYVAYDRVVETPLDIMLGKLVVVNDISRDIPSYNRSEWSHWSDDDGDCQNTRHEVLIAESNLPVSFKGSKTCQVNTGQWRDPYTGTTVFVAGDLDVDHMVPLQNAHISGGWQWSTETKKYFANDLVYADHLIGVTASSNRSKGSRSPDQWKPANQAYWCEYAKDWVRIKYTWDLTVTVPEFSALMSMLNTCATSESFVHGQGDSTPVPSADDGSLPIAPFSSEYPCDCSSNILNCGDFSTHSAAQACFESCNAKSAGDIHRLDADGDGVACESLP